jgi:hypothetical protein
MGRLQPARWRALPTPARVFAAPEIPANFIYLHKIKIISLQGIEVSEIGCFPLEPVESSVQYARLI